MRVLILTAGFGEGHNTAARNIGTALGIIAPGSVEVEIRDLFEDTYGRLSRLLRKAYQMAIFRAPRVWGRFYDLLDSTKMLETNIDLLERLRIDLERDITRFHPDAVVSTFPLYAHVIDDVYERRPRPFRQFTVVTDSITINSVWYRCGSDRFLVPNEPTARVLREGGVDPRRILVLGFPVSHRFADPDARARREPLGDGREARVLILARPGWRSVPRLLGELMEIPGVRFTVSTGRQREMEAKLRAIVWEARRDDEVMGWSDRIPELLLSHHLVIGKAGGATVQEAIAACCPMIINQVVPGQEEGNARLLLEGGAAVLADRREKIVTEVRRIFGGEAREWRRLHANIARMSRPAAALDIARFILGE